LLKLEADLYLYKKGLFDLLSKYGKPLITGSYALNLMTARDLDIYLESKHTTIEDIYKLTIEIMSCFNPVWFEAKRERTSKLPCFFIGFESLSLKNKLWNFDIWFQPKNIFKRQILYQNSLSAKMTLQHRQIIFELKTTLSKNNDWGVLYSSKDIYNAVIFDNIYSKTKFIEKFK
jgi:hypothetical protein